MKKVVAFCGSPRKKGVSWALMNRVLEGAKAQGCETVTYDLNAEGIRGCQHCYYCRTHDTCVLKDTLSGMYKDIVEADAIVFSTPIYFCNLSGQSKIWLDRLFPMFDSQYKSRFPGKKCVTIFAQAFEDGSLYQNVFDEINGRFDRWDWKVIDSIVSPGHQNASADVQPELLERAYKAGIKLGE